MKNMDFFLKSSGVGMISIKARCIDVTKKPNQVFMEQKEIISKRFDIEKEIRLDPYEQDHILFIVRKK